MSIVLPVTLFAFVIGVSQFVDAFIIASKMYT